MSHGERRRPRAAFTRLLEKMCQRFDRRSPVTLARKDFLGLRESATYQVADLWVVGSYARGAPDCGDLDLIIQSEPASWGGKAIARRMFGSLPDVRIYGGTPEQNSAGRPFSEAVHIWSPGASWREAIASIAEDSTAGRFARTHDALPFRAGEQIAGNVDWFNRLVELKQSGTIQWRFIGYEKSPEVCPQSPIEEHLARLVAERWGKRSRALFPFVFKYLRTLPCSTFRDIEQTTLGVGGVHVDVGRPSVWIPLLDTLECSRIAAVPHLSQRGPNGLWEVRRGDAHPLVRELGDATWYVLRRGDGPLLTTTWERRSSGLTATGIELFATEQLAETLAARWAGDSENRVRVHPARGADLLDLVSHADVLELRRSKRKSGPIAVSFWGEDALGTRSWRDNHARLISLLRQARR